MWTEEISWWPWNPRAAPVGGFGADSREEEVASECQAFLLGRSADVLCGKRLPVGAWAWVNRVAHAGPEELRALATRRYRCRLRHKAWHRATSELAHELLTLAEGRPQELRRLQVEALLPLELELARTDYWASKAPRAVAALGMAELLRSYLGQ